MCHVIFKIQLVQLGNILYLFNIQITAHLFHGRLHLNIRICCNYPEISSGRLLLNNCWNSWSLYYSLLGPSSVWSESSSSRTKKFEYESSIEYSQGPACHTSMSNCSQWFWKSNTFDLISNSERKRCKDKSAPVLTKKINFFTPTVEADTKYEYSVWIFYCNCMVNWSGTSVTAHYVCFPK